MDASLHPDLPTSGGYRVEELTVDEVDRVAHLFQELVEFHGEVVKGAWPVRRPEDAWALRREQYLEWLGEGSARMLAAVRAEGGGQPLGYAVLSVKPSMPSWDVGPRVGELETLAVAAAARGQGIGTMLIEACQERLRAEDVTHWAVGVVEANEGATKLYERAGFKPFYRDLLAKL
ncbi:MAG TPA: GNAT family N-acetyltransferase [Solirubrobacterales bacterium]|nr:GNAT family N-acetyltransferase [Solirubrobacterales bacterium]